jgi:hypothetical protein
LQLQRIGVIVLLAAPQRQRDETTVNDLDTILAPACRALFGGTPAELGIALHSSARLRSAYTRRPAMEMAAARRAGDIDAARLAAAFALRAVEVGA